MTGGAAADADASGLRLPLAEERYLFWTRSLVRGVEAVIFWVLPARPLTTLAVALTANSPDDYRQTWAHAMPEMDDPYRPNMACLLSGAG
jgi:hypothetical protein